MGQPLPSSPLLPSVPSILVSLLLLPAVSASPPLPYSTSPATPPAAATSTAFRGGGLHLPLSRQNGHLHHISKLHKREHKQDVVRQWALREKGRLGDKYRGSEERLRKRDLGASENDEEEKRRRQRRRNGDRDIEGPRPEGRQILSLPATTTSTSRTGFQTAGVPASSASSTSESQEYGATTTRADGAPIDLSASATSSEIRPQETLPVGLVHTLNSEADLSYYAPVGIGVPPQYMNCILDTGSADLWLASSLCASDSATSTSSSTGCTLDTPLYNTTLSSTSLDMNTSFSVRYGSGSAQGEIWQDYVGFAGYNVSSQGFALVEQVSEGLLSGEISGLMGLGWQPLAASHVTPFWQNLYSASALPFPGFAVSLTRFINVPNAASIEPGGSITFGYLNASLYSSEINYVPIPSGAESYWVVKMDGVRVNGTNVTSWGDNARGERGGQMVAIDTGTTLIGGPSETVKSVYAEVEGARAATGDYSGYYSYPCDANVSVALSFGGIAYNMTPEDFNLGPFGIDSATNRSTCLGAFFELSIGGGTRIQWVIGAAFLKNVYSVYRASPPSVGFALPPNSTSLHLPSFPSNSSDPARDMDSGNLTAFPNPIAGGGIYGPSGGVSVRTTLVAANTVTTAVQAGGTVGRVPSSAAARGVGGDAMAGLRMVLAVAAGVILVML
ncbi:hypothetical protein JCM11641_002744 [Rhodosporidiobolus odoratus]